MPGVGEKGASQLLQKYGSLDAILDHASEQTPKRREALTEHADAARRTRDLAIIRTDAPVGLDLDDVPPLDYGPDRMQALRELFDRFEFGSLIRRLEELAEGGSEAPAPPADVTIEVTAVPATPEDLPLRLAGASRVALALTEETWAVAGDGEEVAVGPRGDGAGAALAASLAGLPVTTHDAKAAIRATADELRPVHDTMVAAYLLEPRRRGYPLDELAGDAGLGAEGTDEPAALDAALVRELTARQEEGLRREGLEPLYREVELPLTRVLAAMEEAGVKLDVHRLGEIAARVRDRADELRDRIWELAGGEFVIDSPKQLGEVLFERLGLPTFRRGKTGWSTDRKVLQLLAGKHPIIELIGQYRELTKLDSTYLSALPELVDEAGRLHTTLAQTVAETGRLSSNNPNLQNIPIRTPLGREIRGAFTHRPGLARRQLRLQPGGAPDPRPRLGGAGPGGRVPPRRGHPPRHRGRGLRHGPGRRQPHHARPRQGGQLRDRLRHQRLRPGRSAQHPARRRRRLHRGLPRPLPAGAQLHRPHRGGRRPGRLRHHPVRPPPADPRARGPHGPAAPARRAAGGQHGHPGDRGRHHQGGDGRAPTTPSPRPGCRRA